MNTFERLKRSIALRNDDVFLRADFAALASDEQLGRALRKLLSEGRIVRIGRGVYARAKPSVLSGKPIPIKPIEILAPIALSKLGIKTRPTDALREYNEGKTTQVPAGVVINTGRQRISRQLGFGNVSVRYENDYTSAK